MQERIHKVSYIISGVLLAAILAGVPADLRAQPAHAPDDEQAPPGEEGTPEDGEDDIVIEGQDAREGEYIRRRAPGVIKSDASIMETPSTVQIIPRQVYEDQKADNLGEAARNVSNVIDASQLGVGDNLYIRGFQTFLFNIDGLPNTAGLAGYAPREMSRYEHIEISKGPSSVLFGAIEPGGAINLVTKKPEAEAKYTAEVSHGRWDNNAATLDFTGPLTEDRTLLYRLIGTYRSADSFRDEVETERGFVAPSLSWFITPDTMLTVFAHYQRDVIKNDRGVPAPRDTNTAALRELYAAQAPALLQTAFSARELFPEEFQLSDAVYTEKYFGNMEGEQNEQVQGGAGYSIESEFDHWILRHRSQGESSATKDNRTTVTGVDPDNRTVSRRYDERAWYIASYNTQLAAEGKYESDGVVHRPYLGVDFTHTFLHVNIMDQYSDAGRKDLFLSDSERAFFDDPSNIAGVLIAENFDPGVNPKSFFPVPIGFKLRLNSTGVTGRYQLSLGEMWHVLAGARYDNVQGFARDESYGLREQLFFVPSITPTLYTNPRRISIKADSINPQGGLLFRPIKQISFYAGASTSFTQDYVVLLQGGLAPEPVESVGYEGGVKFQFFDEKMTATVAGFEIRKSNIAVPDPLDIGRLIQSGEQTHRGWEVDLLASPAAGLDLIASYGYIEAEITKDETRDPDTGKKILEGNRPGLVPEHTASFWVVYEFQRGFARGFGLGGGAYYNSERYATGENVLVLPQYTIANALVYYRFTESVRASVTVKNLYNERYYAGATNRFQVHPGRPFEAIFAVDASF